MELRVKAKLITCSLIEHLKEQKKEQSCQNRPYIPITTQSKGKSKITFTKETWKQPKQPVPVIRMLLEESRPQNTEARNLPSTPRLARRFSAQSKPKVVEEKQVQHQIVLRRVKPEPMEPDLHLAPLEPNRGHRRPSELIRLEDEYVEKGPKQRSPSHPHYHNLDKNFVRMLKEKQMRAKVDAENAEIIASKLKIKKKDDLENIINEKKMHSKCDEGQKWQEKVEHQQKRQTNSLATFWNEQNEVTNLINGQKLQTQEDFSNGGNEEESGTAQHFVYKQLADIKLKKAASLAKLQEKQYTDAVTAQRNVEEAEKKREESKRLAAVGEFKDHIQKVADEKERRSKTSGQQEKEEMSHKMKVFDETEDIQKCLMKEHCKSARRIQEGYAKAINEEFAYKQSKKRILCHAPIDGDHGPHKEMEWPYFTLQGNYKATISGAPLTQKRKPQSSNGFFSPQRLCLTSECYTFGN